MATIKRFEDIEAWKKARELAREVYRHSKVVRFQRTSGSEIKCVARLFLLCQTSPRVLSVAVQRSSCSFLQLQKAP